jgi:hypothetical protein
MLIRDVYGILYDRDVGDFRDVYFTIDAHNVLGACDVCDILYGTGTSTGNIHDDLKTVMLSP